MAATSNVPGLAEGVKLSDLHPKWYPPKADDGVGLKVLNSLVDTLVPFAPKNGRVVKWYTCGPTVYDVSHMGHARAYLTFDIIRRLLEDYFGYQVQYQINITDIDDKIIKKARVNKLLDDYKKEVEGDLNKLKDKIKPAVEMAEKSLQDREAVLNQPLPEGTSKRIQKERETKIEELQLKKKQVKETADKIAKAIAAGDFETIFATASGPLGELLDSEKGDSITDQGIFDAHAKKYEATFFEDCERLGIRPPDILTRVSEVVPEVVTFIQKIIDNGFAYVGESSVFFDTQAFVKAGHAYPKLKPTSEAENTTADEMAEGEGALTTTVAGEKRHPNDFALWKFSKPGEPRWPSPWGDGRPGWHIECSVMASGTFGENMDIHAGGFDLRFPHHDNELAQSEAYWGHHQWVNYFFHCGHLHIEGLKMSKSLKNFITIRQALDGVQTPDGEMMKVTPREMRILFLSTPWFSSMNFSDQALGEARERERVLRSFFGTLDIEFRKDFLKSPQGFTNADKAIMQDWANAESTIDAAFKDNFDTKTAFTALMNLVTATNAYLKMDQRTNLTLLRKIGRYITRILQVFGIVEGGDDIGLSDNSSSGDQRIVPVVDSLVQFRDDVRRAAREKKPVSDFLPMCDALRDKYLPPAGIRLEDKPDGSATQWKFDDPEVLQREIAEKEAQLAAAQLNKLKNQLSKEEQAVSKWAPFIISPEQLFKEGPEADKYTAWDEAGIPTKMKDGTDVSDKLKTKLQAAQTKHSKGCENFKEKGGTEMLEATKSKVSDIKAQIAAQEAPSSSTTGGSA